MLIDKQVVMTTCCSNNIMLQTIKKKCASTSHADSVHLLALVDANGVCSNGYQPKDQPWRKPPGTTAKVLEDCALINAHVVGGVDQVQYEMKPKVTHEPELPPEEPDTCLQHVG